MGRWLWRGLLVLLAVGAVGAELDRASATRPQLAIAVPGPFRSTAQATIATLALTAADSATARAESRRLVRRRPMPAEHLFTLAVADLRAKHPQAFTNDFRAASTRGWRYAPLQAAAAQGALQNNDLAGAANRVAALWAAAADDPSTPPLTTALLNRPGGPEAFAIPLSQTHVWANSFLGSGAALAPPGTIARTVAIAQRHGARFDCDAIERLNGQLMQRTAGAAVPALSCH
jgi:hypothetical protein